MPDSTEDYSSDSDQSEFELSSLQPGDMLVIDGPDESYKFRVATSDPAGPLGSLETNEEKFEAAQLIGCVPILMEPTKWCYAFLPGILLLGECYVLALITSTSGDHRVDELTVGGFHVERAPKS